MRPEIGQSVIRTVNTDSKESKILKENYIHLNFK
jgi:hypothetical protein